ncbi:acyltransferase family protein [Spirosoma panaciterrae]|uniref:acyltransferase family protein n=1 Tax=Spirosoma panaciterrae TaxID=496058 RepID=UPI00037FF0CB|nr:acyltransferase [Spirosoma panaciterrae]
MRFRAVDTFRGMAAILVIFFHLQHLSILKGNDFVAKSDIFVDFFFVLSGFVMTHSNYAKITDISSIRPFAIKRFKRLYPLHLFTLILVLLFELFRFGVDRYVVRLSNPVFGPDKSFVSLLANLTLTQSLNLFDSTTWNGPSWSISVEFYTYLLWALCLVVFRKNLWVMCTLCFGLIAWFIVQHQGNIIYNYDYGFIRCFYSFLLGMLTYRLSRRWQSAGVPWLFSIAEMLLLGITLVAVSRFQHAESWMMPFLFALMILVFSQEKGRISGILASDRLEFLGKLSYSYYLNHMVVLNVLDLVIFRVIKVPATPLGEWSYVLLCLIGVHLLSLFTYRYVELILQTTPPSRVPRSIPQPSSAG